MQKQKLAFPGQQNFVVGAKGANRFSNFLPGLTGAPVDTTGAGTVDTGVKTGGGGPTLDGGPTLNPPALPVMPVFPDFTIMDCSTLADAISNMISTVNAQSLVIKNQDWLDAYNNAITSAQSIYKTKGCVVGSGGPTGILTPAGGDGTSTTGTGSGSGAGAVSGGILGLGGLSGGGAGSTTPAATTTKKPIPWLWIAVGAGLLYLLMSGKKSAA